MVPPTEPGESNSPFLKAHSPAFVGGSWHDLHEHLRSVAARCEQFAESFGFGRLAYVLGLGHDLGKADSRFQEYLIACAEGRVAAKCPHAVPSGKALLEDLQLFCLPIIGHHMGLKDLAAIKNHYLPGADSDSVAAAESLWKTLRPSDRIELPSDGMMSPLEAELLIRMLFSCLVDADFLDTEQHFDGGRVALRGHTFSLPALANVLREHMAGLDADPSIVNQVRAEVLDSCRLSASMEPAAFRLTVPTGGGKTLSSLSFALDHAAKHNLDRIIVAIPYTSIIDQTAEVYGHVFGDGAVLEHHSAVDPDVDSEFPTDLEVRNRLAAENWDAPIVVTTTVQLFESLFASRTSRCRKLHNIARSVIVLDEVQTLPPGLLEPILDVLGQLIRRYGCTVVFCTATQPDFTGLKDALSADSYALLSGAVEIVPSPERHFSALRRVTYDLEPGPLTADQLGNRVDSERQILCVLNTRKDAVRVLKACQDRSNLFHLSTLMCPHHRKQVLAEVRGRLAAGATVKLVATQVVEAGVDVDFPLVMRDMGPLDRIVQVAGRCNREGKMALGRCVVFELEGGSSPRGAYRTGLELTKTILREAIDRLDRPDTIASYFRDFYRNTNTDAARVQPERSRLNFEKVSHRFRMIQDDSTPFVVENYGPADKPEAVMELLSTYASWNARSWFRSVGQYCVSVPDYEFLKLSQMGWMKPHESGLIIFSGPYDDLFGIGYGEERDPADLII